MTIENLKALVNGFGAVPHGESTLPGQKCLHCVCEAAQREVEALEKAARSYTTSPRDMGEAMAFDNLMETIAKEIP